MALPFFLLSYFLANVPPLFHGDKGPYLVDFYSLLNKGVKKRGERKFFLRIHLQFKLLLSSSTFFLSNTILCRLLNNTTRIGFIERGNLGRHSQKKKIIKHIYQNLFLSTILPRTVKRNLSFGRWPRNIYPQKGMIYKWLCSL